MAHAVPGAEAPPEELARRAAGGAVEAFEELVARFEGPLYQFLRVRVGRTEIAEELTQDAFLRAWQNLSRYDSRWRFSTWLFTLAQRLAVSHHRRRREETGLPEREEEGLDVDPAVEVAARDEGRRLWAVADRVLSPDQRSALWLRYAEDLEAAEIGRILDRPAVTVRVLLFRAREVLARHLAPEGEEDPVPNARRGAVPVHNGGTR